LEGQTHKQPYQDWKSRERLHREHFFVLRSIRILDFGLDSAKR
jgi:hypothetical protein